MEDIFWISWGVSTHSSYEISYKAILKNQIMSNTINYISDSYFIKDYLHGLSCNQHC